MKEQQEKYNLPEGWIWTTIDEVGIVVSGGTPSTKNKEFWGGDIAWITPADLSGYSEKYILKGSRNITQIGLDYSSAKLLPKGSVLFSSRAPIGYVVLAQNTLTTSQGFKNLIPMNQVDSEYIYYYFLTLKSQAEQVASGTTFLELSAKSFSKLPFPLCSLDEQRLIVSQIDLLFSKLDEAKKGLRTANSSLKIYRQALLKNAFEGQLTSNWRKDLRIDAYQELTDIKRKRKYKYDTEVNNKKRKKIKIDFEFSYERDNRISSWAVSNLDNLIDINARIGWRGLTKKEYTSEGALFLSVHSLNYGKNVVFKDANFISIQRYEESPEIQLKENDILLCKDGAGIGKVGIIKKLPDIATVNSSLLVIDAREVFNPDFLYYFFLGPDMQRLVNEKISGSAIPHLFQKDIKKFKLKVPPILEQDKIVEILESRFTLVDNLEKTIDNVLNEIIALKHSILKKAFEGRLVSYTSNESVENLLNDIQEEKRLYLENQKEMNRSKSKQKKKMEEKKSILDILKKSDSPISAQELWEKSTSEGDIERFYSEIKEIYHQIDEVKSKTESLLTLKDENK
ncbi:restriction endonuclease subunit S [Flavobacterium sp. D11R37]|uniref:restriction endonuclease subunit S n=1 Tax=Flavobacterium coralii TaxID=2838017 RepID=UPI001CA66C4E|nr:restriction endonuclease subunit S [Flavobacterium coralii]MBY8964015.1 restriction endonuclease subunit S [Flavobacterium coralii]